MKTLSDIRFLLEREVKDTIENEDIINWCNQVNMDVGASINVPSATPLNIVLDTTKLHYTLPADLKVIHIMRMKSDIDAGIDNPLTQKYRIYNGEIIFPNVFWSGKDTLVIDYFKHMRTFQDIANPIDIDDRFAPMYTFYCKIRYHNEQKSAPNVHWRVAINSITTLENDYANMRRQVISYYSLNNEPTTIEERW